MNSIKPIDIVFKDDNKFKKYCEIVTSYSDKLEVVYKKNLKLALKDIGLTEDQYQESLKKVRNEHKKFDDSMVSPQEGWETNVAYSQEQVDKYSKNVDFITSLSKFRMVLQNCSYKLINSKIAELGFDEHEAGLIQFTLITDASYFSYGIYLEVVKAIYAKL